MIRPQFTNEAAQDELAHSLRWRMRFWGLINLVFSPFIVIMMVRWEFVLSGSCRTAKTHYF